MDNITPLRELSPNESLQTKLLKPQQRVRFRSNTNTDTPLPPDEPMGENPPDGAMIDYSLGPETSGPVTLEILRRARALGSSLCEHRSQCPPRTRSLKFRVTG